MDEQALIASIQKRSETLPRPRGLVRGIGDDCAVLRPQAGEDLVFTSDQLLEGRHFTLPEYKAAEVGHKALARSLSDLAAMGSKPVFCLVSLALPKTLGTRWADSFFRGLLQLAREEEMALAGGDLASFERVTVDVTCCGSVPRDKALLRSGAKAGDLVYVTGTLGGEARNLRQGRHRRTRSRIAVGLELRELRVSACMDLSDGLSLDLQRLCLASGVAASLDDSLPHATGATLEEALHGGEDYELLFTARPRASIPMSIHGVAVTRIGSIERGSPGRVTYNGRLLKPGGFDHFS